MATIQFAEWRPDIADVDGAAAATATNVLAGQNCYLPMPAFSVYSTNGPATAPLGAFQAQSTDGSYVTFVGTSTKLYRLNPATLAFADVSKSGGYGVTDGYGWDFTQFGNLVIAVAPGVAPQKYNVASSSLFADLAGSPPQAAYVATIGDFVVLGSINGNERRVQWSDINNAENWTAGGSSLSDYQDMADGGWVTGLTGAEFGMVFQEKSIRRMTFAPGSPYIFEFQRVSEAKGCIAQKSITRIQDTVFYLAEDGFCAISPAGVIPIGRERVDRWFFDRVDLNEIWKVVGKADPISQRVYWALRSENASGADQSIRDYILVFDIVLNRWTLIDYDVTYLLPASTASLTLEGLDALYPSLDAMGLSLDSREFVGGRPQLGAFNTAYKIGFFSGSPMAATIDTGVIELYRPHRGFLRRVSPVVDTTAATITVATKDRYGDTETSRTAASQNSSGWCHTRAEGRMHRITMDIPASTTWTKAHGVEVEAEKAGMR